VEGGKAFAPPQTMHSENKKCLHTRKIGIAQIGLNRIALHFFLQVRTGEKRVGEKK